MFDKILDSFIYIIEVTMRDIKFLTTNLIAHRGIHNKDIKENTLQAFDKAIMRNMPIELDIQLTKDNIVVVYHDESLKRLTQINKKIKNLTYKQLHQLVKWIPTFEETLQFIDGKVPLLIELKSYSKGHKLEQECVKLLDKYTGKYAVQSFNPWTIYWFKKNRKDYIRGQLATNGYNYNFITNIIYRHMLFTYINKPDFISYNIKGLPNNIISKFRKKDVILGWTIRDKKQLTKYRNYCDNFIVENV